MTVIFGATGLLGSAIARAEKDPICVSSRDFDARDPIATQEWFRKHSSEIAHRDAHICCGRVAGIGGQRNIPMLEDNMLMAINLIRGLREHQITGRTIYYSSSCVYPNTLDIFSEGDMFTGEFEISNEGYAIAKAAGQRLAAYSNSVQGRHQFITVIPPNLYGDNDNWDPQTSHVLPALTTRMAQAVLNKDSEFVVWGEPDTRREFLRSDEVASAAAYLLTLDAELDSVNVGRGEDITIDEIVQGLAQRMNYTGKITYTGDRAGKKRKLLRTDLLNSLGWQPKYTYDDMLDYMVSAHAKL